MKEKELTVYTATVEVNEETGVLTRKRGVAKLPNTLESMQGFVGGWIECVTLSENLAVWVHEEGKLIGLPLNFAFTQNGAPVDVCMGSAFFTHGDSDEDGNTRSITQKGIEEARTLLAAGEIEGALAELLRGRGLL